ncbi:GerAB/ArcD/ProY family transporter [Paenibacillus sp. R14(2021)]|uniref:GerAB/ArcD/ProY family transporter n=1 Tax=Paenibacillus sp. R14(2021) TaxID=2859228 RepID=UPI001C612528|nr:GerAB/ArcD/ProY family transporter [Paenibacillus sp. R14(2021)]
MKSTEHLRLTISPFLVFILFNSMQIGNEYLSMSNKLIQAAGQDSWISVILCGISFHVIIWMIYDILNHHETDLFRIHRLFFGKWAGESLNVIFIAYFLTVACFYLREFIEIIQVWLFPELVTWALALVLLLLAYYITAGGFRVIVGICVVCSVRYLTVIVVFFAAGFFHFNNLTPVLDHSLGAIIQAGKGMTFPFMGVEMLFFCYTFIRTPNKSQKWAHWANLLTTVTYLIIIFFSLLLFKPEQLSKEIWPQLTKYKFVQFPFIERFEFVGAVSQILSVIPIICFCLWASSRMLKFMFTVKQLTVLPFLIIMVFIAVCLIPDRHRIEDVQTTLTQFGFYMIYAYVPFLFIVNRIRMMARRTI